MLVIRKTQMEALAAADRSRFEVKMLDHLQAAYPQWAARLQPEHLREFVRHGMTRAGLYGFRTELDVARYLHVMHDLAKDFDVSADYPWVQALLTSEMPASEKMDRLRDAAEYAVEARRIRDGRS